MSLTRKSPPAHLLLLITAGSSLFAGCTSGAVATDEPVLAGIPQPRVGADLLLELDKYDLTVKQRMQIETVKNQSLRSCMQRYWPSFHIPRPSGKILPRNMLLLGQLDLYRVAEYGYAGPPGVAKALELARRGGAAEYDVPTKMVPAFVGTSTGIKGEAIPVGGCLGDVQRQLDAGAPTVDLGPAGKGVIPDRSIEWLKERVYREAISDRRYRQAITSWSACMRNSGYSYTHPQDAEGDRRWARDMPAMLVSRPTITLQIETAVADQACRRKVNYSGMLYALMLAYEKPIIRTHARALLNVRELMRKRLMNSVAIARQNSWEMP